MKFITIASAAILPCRYATAHYQFSHLIVNGTVDPDWKYVRNITYDAHTSSEILDYMGPLETFSQEELDSTNVTCGRGAFKYAGKTRTATVLAGSQVGFGTWNGTDWIGGVWHGGPAHVYMSKPPQGVNLQEWPGYDGEWFKIAYWGPKDEKRWTSQNQYILYFDIPKSTPPGPYLLRIEQWMPRYPKYSQWYINCAHINVVGPGGGKPEAAGTARFPGSYKFSHPGISVPIEVMETRNSTYWDAIIRQNLTLYTPPGPTVWTGK